MITRRLTSRFRFPGVQMAIGVSSRCCVRHSFVVLVALLATACGENSAEQTEALPRPVPVFRVVDANLLAGRALPGQARSAREAMLSFRIAGRIQEPPPAVGLLLEQPHALERLVLERELERRPHVGLELLEEREGLVEELAHPLQPVGGAGLEAAHGGERLAHHGGDEGAPAREVPVGGRAGDAGLGRDLGHRGDAAALHQRHGLGEEPPMGPGARTALGARAAASSRGRAAQQAT